MSEVAAIYLTPEETADFMLFRQFESQVKILIASGVLNIKGGNFTVDLDEHATIRQIRANTLQYKK